jgi:hypothetical protein
VRGRHRLCCWRRGPPHLADGVVLEGHSQQRSASASETGFELCISWPGQPAVPCALFRSVRGGGGSCAAVQHWERWRPTCSGWAVQGCSSHVWSCVADYI